MKRQFLGNRAGNVPPAWRETAPLANGKQKATEQGSKILLTNLPVDVGEKEVEVGEIHSILEILVKDCHLQDLFTKTVGPLQDSFLIYNSSGKSKGMAIVSFQRAGDAAVAREEV
jgi:THO complex subunit 4